jgi:hypothetical protein
MHLAGFPITFDTLPWCASTSTVTLLAFAAFVLYAFGTATAGYRRSTTGDQIK